MNTGDRYFWDIMAGTSTGWDDTIVASGTPPGIGAIGIVRLSGANSFYIVNELFPSKDLAVQPSHTLHVGYLKEGDKIIDEVVLSLYKNPKSYTGEDVIEISGHGSPFVQQQIMEACIRKGARLAKPGEFTQRAFLNGKLDLTQAEAVADLIASNTAASQRTALHAMRGGFSEKLKELRERLIRFSALIELELDFSQEDVEFADRKQFYELIAEMQLTTGRLISSFQLGNVIKNGVSVAIIGKPNAGKSTLLNTLLNEERAIVSHIPGTTRDTIEEVINIEGILFRLIDTAGIRQHTSDTIESAGVERSLEKMKHSNLVIYLFDIHDEEKEVRQRKAEMDARQLNYILVANKVDATGEQAAREKFRDIKKLIFISAKEKSHIDLLKEKMVETVMAGTADKDDTIVTNARHYQALHEVEKSLTDIKAGLDNKLPGDLLALDIRRCLLYLGEITGEVSNDDMLDYIFSKFCIGK
ncbi:MAG: tRNA modification GTPase trmE [Chitinophagaceae bacterium]|nr:tRNA modification GTPase trmE [Chitinophagaceae bacterium]